MTEFHSTKVPGWVWAVAIGVPLFQIAVGVGFLLLTLVSFSGGEVDPPFTVRVTYQVYGTPATAEVFTVTAQGRGADQQVVLPLDSRDHSFVARQGQDLFVDAIYRGGPGALSCAIFVNGRTVVAHTATIGFADFQKGQVLHVTCEATA